MTEEILSDALLDQLQRAVNMPETVSDEERETWTNDSQFRESFQTMMAAKHALIANHQQEDLHKEAFQDFLKAHNSTPHTPHSTTTRRSALIVRIGLALAAACLVGWLVLPVLISKQQTAGQPNVIYQASHSSTDITVSRSSSKHDKSAPVRQKINVPQGQTAMLTLSDGTKVWLNTESYLIYPATFADDEPRQVELRGEAFFEVAPDASRPFIVSSGKLLTTALGTSFNVRNYPESTPCVTLVTGSVNVTDQQQQLLLEPSQSVTLESSGQLHKTDADLESVLCWRDDLFFFDGKTLHEVLFEMGRWYNTDVIVNNDTHLNDRLHFRGERNWKLSELVESLNIICDIELLIDNGALVLN